MNVSRGTFGFSFNPLNLFATQRGHQAAFLKTIAVTRALQTMLVEQTQDRKGEVCI